MADLGAGTSRRPRRGPRPVEEFDAARPFTRAEALQAGIEPQALRTTAYRRLLPNVYVDAAVPLTPGLRAVAPLAVAHPVAWASHASAGRVYGVPLPPLPGEHISVLDKSQRLRRAGVTSHVAPHGSRITRVHGHRVSPPTQLFVELAGQLSLVDIVVAGDWLVRQGMVTCAGLVEYCAQSRLPGAKHARTAAAYVRDRVDSPMESRLRMLIVLAGLPEPEVNRTVTDVRGQPVRRYDLCWPNVRVIVEYDGRHHVEREAQWEADLDRREAIDDDGWRILVVTSKGVYVDPGLTLDRIARLLRARRLTGVPARLSDAWRPHFPGRGAGA